MKAVACALSLLLPSVALAAASCPFPPETRAAPPVAATGFAFAEGPIWHGDRWLFSDVMADAILSLDINGAVAAIHAPSGYANGAAKLADGRLVSARHDRTLAVWELDGRATIIADRFAGAPLNSPNDVAVDPAGTILFTDPPFGIQGYGPAEAEEAQPVRGVYALTPPGVPRLLTGALSAPNGIAFGPEGDALYVSDTEAGTIHRFAYDPAGPALGPGRMVAEPGPGVDGIAIDGETRLCAAQPGGVGVYDAIAKGPAVPICVIAIPEIHVSNVTLGADALLITATDRVILVPFFP